MNLQDFLVLKDFFTDLEKAMKFHSAALASAVKSYGNYDSDS